MKASSNSNKGTIKLNAIKQQLAFLRQENQKLKKQVKKNEIHEFLESVLDTGLSKKVLVDVDVEGDLIVLGRPSVFGSSKKQMRHVTPYSFVEQLIKTRIASLSSPNFKPIAKDLFKGLSKDIKNFLPHEEGLCLNEEQYKILESVFYEDGLPSKLLKTTKNKYYLLNMHDLPTNWDNELVLNPAEFSEASILYNQKKQKFIEGSLKLLQKAIIDENTYTVACEALTRLIFTLFNQQPYTAFPEEGNSINYEIRLYSNSLDASKPAKKEYIVMKSWEIKQRLDNNENLDNRVRVVDNEGPMVQKVIKALRKLYDLAKLINPSKNDLKLFGEQIKGLIIKNLEEEDGYNIKYNKPFCLSNNPQFYKNYTLDTISYKLNLYNQGLNQENLYEHIPYHVAKQLYIVFDFKPLEADVFVPSIADKEIKVQVFPSSTGNKKATYSMKTGLFYRAEQENSIRKGDYNNDVSLRTELAEFINVLAKKVVDHVFISMSSYEDFDKLRISSGIKYAKAILDKFIDLVALDYDIDGEEFAKLISEFNYKVNIADETAMIYSSESEVENIGGSSNIYETMNSFIS